MLMQCALMIIQVPSMAPIWNVRFSLLGDKLHCISLRYVAPSRALARA